MLQKMDVGQVNRSIKYLASTYSLFTIPSALRLYFRFGKELL
jgi:hypothetical protein